MDRNADYEWQKRVQSKWKFADDQTPFGCGNLNHQLGLVDGQWIWGEHPWGVMGFYKAISSPLLLYRLAATFDGQCSFYGATGYKSVWWFCLEHVSGHRIGFSEHKGAAGFWSEFYSAFPERNAGPHIRQHEAPPGSLLDDLCDLVSYLTSYVCAHPYDGLVAGEIA